MFFKIGVLQKSFLRIWSHLLKKSLIENFIFLRSARNSPYGDLNISQHHFDPQPASEQLTYIFSNFLVISVHLLLLENWMKTVWIWGFLWSIFHAFGLNTEFALQISVFCPNAGKYRLVKLQIRTPLTQWRLASTAISSAIFI